MSVSDWFGVTPNYSVTSVAPFLAGLPRHSEVFDARESVNPRSRGGSQLPDVVLLGANTTRPRTWLPAQ